MLSKRLTMILDQIQPCETLADVGTDHGYLALEAVQSGKAQHVIAADVRTGPLKQAQKTFAQASVFDKVDFVLSDGIASIKTPLDAVVISGMGADLILKIITQDLERFKTIAQIILQANTKIPLLRKQMAKMGFKIQAESITEDGFFYIVQRYVYSGLCEDLEEVSIQFGVLLDPLNPVVQAYLNQELSKLTYILDKKPDSELHRTLIEQLKTRLEKRAD